MWNPWNPYGIHGIHGIHVDSMEQTYSIWIPYGIHMECGGTVKYCFLVLEVKYKELTEMLEDLFCQYDDKDICIMGQQ
jgi:hypothetical protein